MYMSGLKLLNTLHFTMGLKYINRNFHRHVWIKVITEYLTFYHGTGRYTEISIDMSGLKLLNILYFTIVLVDLQKFP